MSRKPYIVICKLCGHAWDSETRNPPMQEHWKVCSGRDDRIAELEAENEELRETGRAPWPEKARPGTIKKLLNFVKKLLTRGRTMLP